MISAGTGLQDFFYEIISSILKRKKSHVRPRYDKPVMLNGSTYTDSEFGHHYALNKSGVIPAKDKEEVFIRLKEWLNR